MIASNKRAILILLASCFAAHAETNTRFPEALDSPQNPPDHVRAYGSIYDPSAIRPKMVIAQKVLTNVPAYEWRHGCMPTSVGMLMAYFDQMGWGSLMPGVEISKETPIPSSAQYERIASYGHYTSYSLPLDSTGPILPDKSELGGAHKWNSIADYLGTSFSALDLSYGASWTSTATHSISTYLEAYYPELKRTPDDYVVGMIGVDSKNLSQRWDLLKLSIDSELPMIAGVSTEGNGVDHAILIIGYQETDAGEKNYYAYNTWDLQIHAYPFRPAYQDYNRGPETSYEFGVGELIPVILLNDRRLKVHQFANLNKGSYFFTANEQEADVLRQFPNYRYEQVSHEVYSAPILPECVPVYRFLNARGSHFYTANEGEKAGIIQNLPHLYTLEGIAFYVLAGPVGNAKPVYRFFQKSTLSHYFTISEEDKNQRILNDPTMEYNGVAWYAFER
jgi:hypothetical protein